MAVAPPIYVQAPALTPSRYGLLDAADLVVESDVHFLNGVEFETAPCGPAKLAASECFSPPADPGGNDPRLRTLDEGRPLVASGPIVVYHGFSCKAGAMPPAEYLNLARAALAGGESTAVERAVWTGTSDAGDTSRMLLGPMALMGASTDVLTSGAVSLLAGIGLLEEYLSDNYGGVGVLHAPRKVSPYAAAAEQIRWESSKPVTTVGTKWSFGAYPNTSVGGGELGPNDAWIVATGRVMVRRSEVKGRPTQFAEALDSTTNEVFSIAERTYVAAWECVTAAAQVSLES